MKSMSETPSRPQHLFVVRIWSEAANPTMAQWRGSVECISNGQKFYFTSLGDMKDFIALQLSVSNLSLSKGNNIL
jgi:hypothetical protein